jgi:hypothetical protein
MRAVGWSVPTNYEKGDCIMKIRTCILFFLFVLLSVPAYGDQGNGELKDIPLLWKPTDAIKSYQAIDLTVYKNAQFMIKPFADARLKPSEIGLNIEKKRSNGELLVTTKDNVAEWLTDQFSKTLSAFDIDVVKNNGTFTLEAEVVKFFVTEKSTYKAEVALKVRLLSKSNAVIWEGMTSGSATRFGKSYKAENYYEALSNATVTVVHALLKEEAFKRAVQKNK